MSNIEFANPEYLWLLTVLVPMIAQMGYREENITIAFRKNLTITDIIRKMKD